MTKTRVLTQSEGDASIPHNYSTANLKPTAKWGMHPRVMTSDKRCCSIWQEQATIYHLAER